MRVAIDTNILFSAFNYPNSFSAELLYAIIGRHELILSTYVLAEILAEIKDVVHRKFPGKKKAVDEFLISFPHEIIYSPDENSGAKTV